MAGLYNSAIRDYCGEESAISKLSNHFSKDFALTQEGLNSNVNSNCQQSIPNSFNLNELFKNIENENNNKLVNVNTIKSGVVENPNVSKQNIDRSNITQMSTHMGSSKQFIVPNYFSIPQQTFCPPDHSLVAQAWARNELSQFDNSILSEEDFKSLMSSTEDSNSVLRFSDVIRNMTLEEEKNEIEILNDNSKQGQGDFLYDLDQDLKNMREKLQFDREYFDMWSQSDPGLEYQLNEFIFTKDNHYADSLKNSEGIQNEKSEELLNEGIKLYRQGYFSEAMLIFEAVVQVKPEWESGWHYLALSLSENEQDQKATIACKKCLELNKDNLEILLSLSRIYCNDMNISGTISSLQRWLLSNPKYSDIVAQYSLHEDDLMWQEIFEETFESSEQFKSIEQQLNSAQQRNGSLIDPDLEIALGTLYHVIQDYNKSSLHFENAASVSESNALLWNKVATAYCNSGNFDKAISIYQKALELAPGFVRAECNLGVSFYNMGNYSDAIKHALKAYKLQSSITPMNGQSFTQSSGMPDSVVETDPIWTLIRMSCFKMDRSDLDLVVFSRDVDTLSREFDL